ncbi:hypothetical protein ccbrp13_04960 [Ktedonobacteria bacterium brp13]|nr:hypothetical protein ccbrp13_04960 [Ktedonobacteria bacterium brp13]
MGVVEDYHRKSGRPQNKFGRPLNIFGRPQNKFGRPLNIFGRPQSNCGRPQCKFGRPQSSKISSNIEIYVESGRLFMFLGVPIVKRYIYYIIIFSLREIRYVNDGAAFLQHHDNKHALNEFLAISTLSGKLV